MDTYKRTVTREQSVLRAGKIASLCSIISLLALTGQAQTPATPVPVAPETPAVAVGAEVKPEETVILEEFVTTGIRGSAIKAIEVKRNNPQMMEAIVSEDIGKFPDNNVVESLQRVPGIQVTGYGRGQISTVTIRGLNDVTTTLNGRNIFTAAGTAFSLQDMPASLLKEVDIKKTRAASDIESGIAGVIDVHTFRPFDFAGRKIGLAVKGTYNEQADKYDPNVSVLFSERWKIGSTGKFGVLLNASYMTTSYRDQSVETGARFPFMTAAGAPGFAPFIRIAPTTDWFQGALPAGISKMWQAGTDAGLPYKNGSTLRQIVTLDGTPVSSALLDSQYLLAPDAIIQNDSVGKTKRPAANLSIQFAPNDQSEYTFEVFYDGFRNENSTNLLFTQTWEWFNVNPASVTLYPGTNLIKTRTNPNGNAWTSTDMATGKTDSIQYAMLGKWKITPNFQLKSEVVYQDSRYNSTFFAVRTHSPFWDQVGMTMDFNAKDGMPSLKYMNFDEKDSKNWWLDTAYDSGTKDRGSATTLTEEGTLNVDWPVIKKLKFGLYYDYRRAATAFRDVNGNPLVGHRMDTLPQMTTNITEFFDGRADIPSNWATVDANYLLTNPDGVRPFYGFTPSGQQLTQEVFNVNEKTGAAYLQVDEMKVDIAGHKLGGQFGVRAVNIKTAMTFTDRTSRAQTSDDVGVTKFLPDAVVSFEITKDFITRLAYGQTLRRPAFNDLNPTVSYTGDLSSIGYGSASSGNPNLKPTESKNLDFSLEYYFDESSMVSVTAFKRQIDGLVVPFRKRITAIVPNVNTTQFVLSQPDNASNGVLKGVEIGGKYFPKNLPNILQGFGVEGSFTRLSSEQDIPVTNDAGSIVSTYKLGFFNVSKSSMSGTLAYERSRYSARLSYAWRSEFLAGNFDLAANPRLVYNRPERSVNFQFGVKIIEGLTVNLEATNLTDDIQHSYYGNGDNASTLMNRNNWIVGRTFALSARYTY